MTDTNMTYITQQGDMVDAIATRFYGYSSGAIELIFKANPGLADLPPELPANIRLALPVLPSAPLVPRKTVNLWD